MNTINNAILQKDTVSVIRQRSYSEIVEFFDKNWSVNLDGKGKERVAKLDKIFNNPSKKLRAIFIAGTNGKSLTAHFASKLLKREGLTVGTFSSPHILTYNERFICDNETIANRTFTELANDVINAADSAGIVANTKELLTQLAFNYFSLNNVDVAVFEIEGSGIADPATLCTPDVLAITRLIETQADATGKLPESLLQEYVSLAQNQTHVVSADQNKSNLKTLNELVDAHGAQWSMPIRKVVALAYPFEQLHGRCAALAERAATLFINNVANKDALLLTDSLLAKEKGRRGRPTLETKKQLELNPKKTIEQFWKDVSSELGGRFQILDKEKPTILLDNSANSDAFENVLLGIRLLHYQRPLKGLALVVACQEGSIDPELFAKQIRYFFKKISGHIILCPLGKTAGWEKPSWDIEKINTAFKAVKVKARVATHFKDAFDTAKKLVNDRHGLIAVLGSTGVLQEYWIYKGIKKAS